MASSLLTHGPQVHLTHDALPWISTGTPHEALSPFGLIKHRHTRPWSKLIFPQLSLCFSLDSLTNDFCGVSVSAAGDINGDGRDDLIIGAFGASSTGSYSAGSSYVVFGKATPFAATLALSSLAGSNGFRLDGVGEADRAGESVSAWDINGELLDGLQGANSASSELFGTETLVCISYLPFN